MAKSSNTRSKPGPNKAKSIIAQPLFRCRQERPAKGKGSYSSIAKGPSKNVPRVVKPRTVIADFGLNQRAQVFDDQRHLFAGRRLRRSSFFFQRFILKFVDLHWTRLSAKRGILQCRVYRKIRRPGRLNG